MPQIRSDIRWCRGNLVQYNQNQPNYLWGRWRWQATTYGVVSWPILTIWTLTCQPAHRRYDCTYASSWIPLKEYTCSRNNNNNTTDMPNLIHTKISFCHFRMRIPHKSWCWTGRWRTMVSPCLRNMAKTSLDITPAHCFCWNRSVVVFPFMFIVQLATSPGYWPAACLW